MSRTLIFKQTAHERQESRRKAEPGVLRKAPGGTKGHVAAVVRTAKDVEDLRHALGGSGETPFRPILVDRANGQREVIIGDGEASAAELQDLAYKAVNRPPVDFGALREREGRMRKEDYDPAFRDALRRRVAQHKQNPVTDPARVPGEPWRKTLW